MDQPDDGDSKDMDYPANEDALAIPEGPMTRSRARRLKKTIRGLLKMSWKQEECLGRSLINQGTLITIQTILSSS
ncbi:hypothetical protein Bca101_010999 [Brassica carinata]